jgi:para-nitrobenzyl esterase
MNFSRDLSRRNLLWAGSGVVLSATAGVARAGERDVVEVAEGRFRGRRVDGLHVFKGLRYGASTAGAGRFLPPRPAPKFAGVQDAFDYGDQAPQSPGALAAATAMSEDCLRINIWTPALDGRKRPVLLWFHGGGFEAGSGSSPLYDGANMAKRGDVVLCTINHRLNVFGFCNLSSLGGAFEHSGNVGYLDLVAAMRWVKANIAGFGGDPENVMIYGQSGGGRKVSLCFAGKDAADLFAKGVVQSGSHLLLQTQAQSQALTDRLLRRLEIAPGDARRLQQVPQTLLIQAQREVIAAAGYRFEPVLDGVSFEAHPFVPNAPKRTAQVPMMLGTTKTELSNQLGRDPAIYAIDEAGLKQRLARHLPAGDIDEAVSVFRASHPKATPTELFFHIASWRTYIRNATLMAERRSELNGPNNPTWMYQVTWRSPAEGGRRISQHTLDLPFMFDNVARAENLTGPPSDATRVMTQNMAESWLAFAHHGDPNHKGLPHWPTYDRATREVMLFDVPPRVVADPYASERLFMDRFPPIRSAE